MTFLVVSVAPLLGRWAGKLLADAYGLFRLPPITISCSHEHEKLLAGSVSISAKTLYSIVTDVAASLERAGIRNWFSFLVTAATTFCPMWCKKRTLPNVECRSTRIENP
ncbi:creatininase family protein [Saccharopolyspora sp. K220]|nr:creatininase family protein [Saccharopolyspora soli]MCI2420043.1 creatininase family protein [Saccharopolyspora soli]